MFASAKESKKSRFDSCSVRNSVLIISHITFRDCRVHISSDNLSQNSCMHVGYQLSLKDVPDLAGLKKGMFRFYFMRGRSSIC